MTAVRVVSRGQAWNVSITTFLLGMQQALLIPYLSLFAVNQMKFTPIEFVGFLVCFHGTGLIASLVIPAISDRFGNEFVLLRILTVLAVIGFGIYAFSWSAPWIFVATAAFTGPASAQNSLFFAGLRATGATSARVVSSRGVFAVAWVAGPLIGSWLVAIFGFGGLFAALAAVNCAILVLTLGIKRGARSQAEQPLSGRGGTGQVAVSFLVLVLLFGTNVIATTIMPIVVRNNLDGTPAVVGLLFAASAAIETAIFFVLAKWVDRFDPRTLILVGCAPGIIYYLLLANAHSWPLLLVGQLPNAIFIAVAVGAGLTWFQSLMPHRPGLATGLFMNATRIATLLVTPLLGGIASLSGTYQTAAILAAFLTGVAGVLLFLTRYLSSKRTVRADR